MIKHLEIQKYRTKLFNNKGCELSKYETIVTLDGDGQNDPKDIPKLLKIYFDLFLVSGIRTNRKDNYIKKITLVSKFY